jgi:hypothetical protein
MIALDLARLDFLAADELCADLSSDGGDAYELACARRSELAWGLATKPVLTPRDRAALALLIAEDGLSMPGLVDALRLRSGSVIAAA